MDTERSWPFEDVVEGGGTTRYRVPRDFVSAHAGTEAVVVRIGLHDTQVVLVDQDGWWDRWVYHSLDEAKEIARALGVPVHVGEYPEPIRVRMNKARRSRKEFDTAAYPEEGHIGPAIPHPENRPRRLREKDLRAAPPVAD